MKLVYKSGGMIPGGYPYTDPRTGRKWDGFTAGGAGDQAMRIAKYRAANPRIFPEAEWSDPKFISKQILEFQVARLGADKRFFVDIDGVALQRIPPAPKAVVPPVGTNGKCTCGAELLPNYCKTCSGKKITGWTCSVCKKNFHK